MKKIIGNGAGNTILKGAINPGSTLEIESASIGDVNVYGGKLYIQGGVVLEGKAATSGTAAVEFNGGTFGTGGYVVGSTIINSAILAASQTVSASVTVRYYGEDSAMFDLNKKSFFISSGGKMSAYGVTFSGGSTTSEGVFRCSGGTAYFSGCSFLNNSTTANGICFQQGNTGHMEFESCVFSGNSTTSNYGILFKGQNGVTRFADCIIDGNIARYYTLYYNTGKFEASNCVHTSNRIKVTGNMAHLIGTSSYLESCVFSSNYSDATSHGRVIIFNSAVTMSDCIVQKIHNSSDTAILCSAACVCNIVGGTYDSIQNLGTLNLSSDLNLEFISSGTINIASGTSISLVKNISATTITVSGECTVNGAVVSSGTYTSIDSNGNAT